MDEIYSMFSGLIIFYHILPYFTIFYHILLPYFTYYTKHGDFPCEVTRGDPDIAFRPAELLSKVKALRPSPSFTPCGGLTTIQCRWRFYRDLGAGGRKGQKTAERKGGKLAKCRKLGRSYIWKWLEKNMKQLWKSRWKHYGECSGMCVFRIL